MFQRVRALQDLLGCSLFSFPIDMLVTNILRDKCCCTFALKETGDRFDIGGICYYYLSRCYSKHRMREQEMVVVRVNGLIVV